MKENIAKKILEETEQGYDLIAGKFSQTRKHFWRGLEFIKDYSHSGNSILDYGCGNGRLLELFADIPNIQYYGADVSGELVALAKSKYKMENVYPVKSPTSRGATGSQFNRVNFSKLDSGQITIPFADNFFNASYSIAVLHHIPSENLRKELAKEIYSVTAPEGYVIVTVWNLWQKKYFVNIVKNWYEKLRGKSYLDWNDCYISFTDNKVHPVKSGKAGARQGEQFNRVNKFQRYHHAFTKGELRKLFENAGFKTERCEIIDRRNIIYIGKK